MIKYIFSFLLLPFAFSLGQPPQDAQVREKQQFTITIPNQQITSSWSATVNQSGAAVTATNAGWNGSLGAGATTQFGFQATGAGSTAPIPTCVAS